MDNLISEDIAIQAWAEGERRVERFSEDSARRQLLEDLLEVLAQELDRRLGQTFSRRQLVEAWSGSESWSAPVLHQYAPGAPWAWEHGLAVDAAFWRHQRKASDYGQ